MKKLLEATHSSIMTTESVLHGLATVIAVLIRIGLELLAHVDVWDD